MPTLAHEDGSCERPIFILINEEEHHGVKIACDLLHPAPNEKHDGSRGSLVFHGLSTYSEDPTSFGRT
jgi:hypothetical protein